MSKKKGFSLERRHLILIGILVPVIFIIPVSGVGQFFGWYVPCADTDGGLTYYHPGASKGGFWSNPDSVAVDICRSDEVLLEYYCDRNTGIVKHEAYTCVTGCVKSNIQAFGKTYESGACYTMPSACVDSDNGARVDVAGSVSFNGIVYSDLCLGEQMLREYYCLRDEVKILIKKCPCADGRCAW